MRSRFDSHHCHFIKEVTSWWYRPWQMIPAWGSIRKCLKTIPQIEPSLVGRIGQTKLEAADSCAWADVCSKDWLGILVETSLSRLTDAYFKCHIENILFFWLKTRKYYFGVNNNYFQGEKIIGITFSPSDIWVHMKRQLSSA